MIAEAYRDAIALIEEHRAALWELSGALLAKRSSTASRSRRCSDGPAAPVSRWGSVRARAGGLGGAAASPRERRPRRVLGRTAAAGRAAFAHARFLLSKRERPRPVDR